MARSDHPVFQHRHYSALANMIRHTKNRDDLIAAMIITFRRDNPKFNLERFKEAMAGDPTNWRDRESPIAMDFADRGLLASWS